MRNLFFVTIFLLLVLSCGPETEREMRTYVILNETNNNVTLLLSLNNIDKLNTYVVLGTNEIYRGERLELGNLIMLPETTTPVQSLGADEVTIVFDDEYILFFDVDLSNEEPVFSNPLNRNPFRHGSYEFIGDDEFLFTITQEDFENATPCDGPCE